MKPHILARIAISILLVVAVSAASKEKKAAPAQSVVTPCNPKENAKKTEVQETNDAYVAKLKRQIAGQEQEPTEKVFKNIQWLKGIPAERLLEIMDLGYSRALGVTCTHCHDDADFSRDDKRPKRAAREMAVMHRGINEQLGKMKELQKHPRGLFINCSTCHRGAISPLEPE